MHDLMKKYSATVDCSSEKGVNNYADGALALAGNRAAGIHESVNSTPFKNVQIYDIGYVDCIVLSMVKRC